MNKSVVVPTITTWDPSVYKTELQKISTYTSHVSVDLSDGEFAGQKLLPLDQVWWPASWTVDLHLMVNQPSALLALILKYKPALTILHAEATEDLTPTIATLKQAGLKVGIGLLPKSYPKDFAPYLQQADYCLIFGGSLGEQGGTANLLVLEKIEIIKSINSETKFIYDGGVDLSNIRNIAHYGVSIINVGATLARANDPKAMYAALSDEALRLEAL